MVCFIEEEAEVGEYDPQFLPPVAVLELPQQIATQLVLKHSHTLNKQQFMVGTTKSISYRVFYGTSF